MGEKANLALGKERKGARSGRQERDNVTSGKGQEGRRGGREERNNLKVRKKKKITLKLHGF